MFVYVWGKKKQIGLSWSFLVSFTKIWIFMNHPERNQLFVILILGYVSPTLYVDRNFQIYYVLIYYYTLSLPNIPFRYAYICVCMCTYINVFACVSLWTLVTQPHYYRLIKVQKIQQFPVWSRLRGVWGDLGVGSLILVSITTHKKVDSKIPT